MVVQFRGNRSLVIGFVVGRDRQGSARPLAQGVVRSHGARPWFRTGHRPCRAIASAPGKDHMIGPTKLSEIRKKVRTSFHKTDAQLLVWFNQQLQGPAQQKANASQIASLELLRDALLAEVKKPS